MLGEKVRRGRAVAQTESNEVQAEVSQLMQMVLVQLSVGPNPKVQAEVGQLMQLSVEAEACHLVQLLRARPSVLRMRASITGCRNHRKGSTESKSLLVPAEPLTKML